MRYGGCRPQGAPRYSYVTGVEGVFQDNALPEKSDTRTYSCNGGSALHYGNIKPRATRCRNVIAIQCSLLRKSHVR
ncbi:hypothetical protein NDU88_005160 [Pleurodeles waltl]|uniref:Uncharacterized protein n=1 Tax=Pleurodeles waltl TaxID=8319 RepID=A0AAV7PIT2_PLEWA|nr:hypothetical protein NDU88_005160 [Pleurodeles waltl]